MKSTTPYGFYYIDRGYIEAMHTDDNPHVPNADYEDYGRTRKFYCGPVTNKQGVDYFVPVSHEIKDNIEIPGTKQTGVTEYYAMHVYNSDMKKTGNLDFRHMVPCVDDQFLSKIEPDSLSKFGETQYNFCMKNEDKIHRSASDAYENIVSREYPFLNETSVDFDKAYDSAWPYLDAIEERQNNTNITMSRFQAADSLIENINFSNDEQTKEL